MIFYCIVKNKVILHLFSNLFLVHICHSQHTIYNNYIQYYRQKNMYNYKIKKKKKAYINKYFNIRINFKNYIKL